MFFVPDEAVVLLERGLELDPSSHNSLVESCLWRISCLVALILVGEYYEAPI